MSTDRRYTASGNPALGSEEGGWVQGDSATRRKINRQIRERQAKKKAKDPEKYKKAKAKARARRRKKQGK